MSLYDYFTRTNEDSSLSTIIPVSTIVAANEVVNVNCKQYPLRSQWATRILLAVHDVERTSTSPIRKRLVLHGEGQHSAV